MAVEGGIGRHPQGDFLHVLVGDGEVADVAGPFADRPAGRRRFMASVLSNPGAI